MKKSTTHIDDLFKEELGNYAEMPPPAGWDALEKRLGEGKGSRIVPRWQGYVVVASLFIVVGTTVALKKYNAQKQQIAQNEVNLITQNSITAQQTRSADANNGKTTDVTTDVTAESTPKENGKENNTSQQVSGHVASGTSVSLPVAGSKHTSVYNSSGKPFNSGRSSFKNSGMGYAAADQPGNTTTHDGRPTVGSSNENEWNASGIANGNQQAATTGTPAENNPTALNAAAGNSNMEAPADQKNDSAGKKKMTIAAAVAAKPKKQRTVSLFEAGIKGGYETGFNNDAAKKIAIAPYLQVNISDRLAIMVQPSVKTSFLNTRRIGSPASYYEVNPDGKSAQNGSSTPINIVGGGVLYMTKYHYTESHDSIVKTATLSRSYMEFELPILAKYNLGKNFSAYGGVNIAYSKSVSIVERTNNTPGINVAKDTFVITATPAQAEPLPVRAVINYSGNSIATYSGPQYAANQGSEVRLGYMVGFSYEYSRRWLFDALVQQGFAKAKQVGGYDINTTLSAPYVRLMLGYKLTK